MIPARFHREAGSKIVGLLTYAVIAPIIALFIALFVYVAFRTLTEWAGLPEPIAGAVGALIVPIALVAMIRFAVRDYRRRAMAEVTVHWDRIEQKMGKKNRQIRFDEILTLHLVRVRADIACVLQLESGENVRLSDEIAPFSHLRAPLEVTLVTHLSRAMTKRLETEQEISLRESTLKSVFLVPYGAFLVLCGACLVVLGILPYQMMRFFRQGAEMIQVGRFWIHLGRFAARGGFAVRVDGIVPRYHTGDAPIPWVDLSLVRRDASGIVLEAFGGNRLAASSLARNCWPVSMWIEQVLEKHTCTTNDNSQSSPY